MCYVCNVYFVMLRICLKKEGKLVVKSRVFNLVSVIYENVGLLYVKMNEKLLLLSLLLFVGVCLEIVKKNVLIDFVFRVINWHESDFGKWNCLCLREKD